MHKIEDHDFFKTVVLQDYTIITPGREHKLSDIALENANFTEYEYYIHNTGFYLVHFIQLCDQLTYGIELISNFHYNPNRKVGRVDHLTYNIENYIIRLSSLKDRLLQLVNAAFHLCIDESNVGERIILSNLKVSRTELPKYFKDAQKVLQSHLGDRNAIVHKHSYLNKELKRLQIFYSQTTEYTYSKKNKEVQDDFKLLRKEMLSEYISQKKIEFSKLNENYFAKLTPILDSLLIEYNKAKILLNRD